MEFNEITKLEQFMADESIEDIEMLIEAFVTMQNTLISFGKIINTLKNDGYIAE